MLYFLHFLHTCSPLSLEEHSKKADYPHSLQVQDSAGSDMTKLSVKLQLDEGKGDFKKADHTANQERGTPTISLDEAPFLTITGQIQSNKKQSFDKSSKSFESNMGHFRSQETFESIEYSIEETTEHCEAKSITVFVSGYSFKRIPKLIGEQATAAVYSTVVEYDKETQTLLPAMQPFLNIMGGD